MLTDEPTVISANENLYPKWVMRGIWDERLPGADENFKNTLRKLV